MNNIISVFSGIKPTPSGEVEWPEVLSRIQSDRYRPLIERCRELVSNPAEYRKFKVNLPAVTFCGNFSKNRNCQNILAATGFIIPDLDHLPDVEKTFHLLSQDEYIWFCFRSPSGDGLKCALRSEGINADDDIKIFYNAVERYFSSTYGIKIDPACKDISRLTFVSYDPQLFINKNPAIFPIQSWAKQEEQRFYLPASSDNGWKSKYGLKVLDSACDKIRQSSKGEQHRERLKQSRLVGGFVASGFIDEAQALSALEQAVKDSGAKLVHQAMDTVTDGIAYGKLKPLEPEERVHVKKKDDIEYYCDPEEALEPDYGSHIDIIDEIESCKQSKQSKQNNQSIVEKAEVSRSKQDVSRSKQDNFSPIYENEPKKLQNLAAHILEWITNSSGSFTVDQLDREFCLTTRIEKNARSISLHRYIEKKLINRDKRIKGKYHIVDSSLKLVDIFNTDETPFDLKLPFMLHNYVSIPRKAIIVIAGSSNAGKTAILLNILKLNLSQNYSKYYLMSEMGVGEYVERIRNFDDIPFTEWGNVLAAERSCDFNGVIEHHNKNGLTCIDFLEEVEGEYFKISSDIRSIYDSLGDGVAIVAIQKKNDTDYARGGQATAEKSRLYMSVDYLTQRDQSIICALKTIKVKRYIGGRNIQGHEIHFSISGGSKIEPVSEWMRCSDVDRKRCADIYCQPDSYKKRAVNYCYEFKTDAGRIRGINEKNLSEWVKNFSKINVLEELEDIANNSFKSGFLRDKQWFFQIATILNDKNEKADDVV